MPTCDTCGMYIPKELEDSHNHRPRPVTFGDTVLFVFALLALQFLCGLIELAVKSIP